jgi:hypothetical protein
LVKPRFFAIVLLSGFALSVADCGDRPTAPTASGKTALTPTSAESPTTGVPQGSDVVVQNDSSIGCPFDVNRGYGFALSFSWTAIDGATAYHVFSQHAGAQYPAVDTTVDEPSYGEIKCQAFVIDGNLNDWTWKVRPEFRSGEFGDWSPTHSYSFAPCRVSGRPCSAPAR